MVNQLHKIKRPSLIAIRTAMEMNKEEAKKKFTARIIEIDLAGI